MNAKSDKTVLSDGDRQEESELRPSTYRFSEFLYQLLSCPLPWLTWIFSLKLVGVLQMATNIGGDHLTSVLKTRHFDCNQCQVGRI